MAPQILELFPLEDLTPRPPVKSENNEDVLLKEAQHALIFQKPKPVEEDESDEIRRPGELYKRYRTADDLPENARVLYERVGKSLPVKKKMIGLTKYS